jgi:hypothetical protein
MGGQLGSRGKFIADNLHRREKQVNSLRVFSI